MKQRRIPFGLIYIASLVLVIVLIPLLRFTDPQSLTANRHASAPTTFDSKAMRL